MNIIKLLNCAMNGPENNTDTLLFHTIEDINLQLAVIDNLWRENIIPDLKTAEICEMIKTAIDLTNPEDTPIDEVEKYLYSMDIADEALLKLSSFYWGKESLVPRVIWPSWKGDDNYFHIDSFDGIEVLENLRSITGEYFACESADPLPLLSYLEEVTINNATPFRYLGPFLDIMDLKVLHITAEPDSENAKHAEELRKETADIQIVWQDASPETKVRRIYDQVKYSSKPAQEQLGLLNKALEISPGLAWLYQKRGELLFRDLKDLKPALADINKAIELSTEPISSYYTLRAEIYTEMDEYENAVSDHTIAIEHSILPSILARERGKLYRTVHDYDRAISDYTYYIKAQKKENGKISLECHDKQLYLELLEMYICTNNYSSCAPLIQDAPVLMKHLQLVLGLLQYIAGLANGEEVHLPPDLSKEKKTVRSFLSTRDYSHLELWVRQNDCAKDVNDKIVALIEKFKQAPEVS